MRRQDGYQLTDADILRINEMLHVSHSLDIRISGERGMGNHHKKVSIFAPNPGNIWTRAEGFSIEEAVDDWFNRTQTDRRG